MKNQFLPDQTQQPPAARRARAS